MLKQSPSRGHKSKGIKLKHILQICVLLAVCFWLIYQVKHSQDKRKEFDAKDETVVDKVKLDIEILRFGRKDLPRVTELSKVGDKHVEDDEEKEVEEEEDIKLEEEEIKHEADEIDENELEKKEGEHEDGDEQVDEDKEREDDDVDMDENHTENEEKAFPGKEEHFEALENDEAEEIQDVGSKDHDKDDASDDQDRDGDNVDTHEAREEQYKADDASSEVAQHVQTIIPKTENATKGLENDMFGKSDTSDGISNGTVFEQHNSENSTSANFLENQIETTSNSSSFDVKHRLLSNGLQTTYNPNVSETAFVEGASGGKDPNLLGNVLGDNNKTELASDENIQSKASGLNPNKTDNVSNNVDHFKATVQSSMSNESHDEKLVNSKDEDARLGQNDPIDEADTNVAEEEKSRVDLDTLPSVRTEGQNAESAVAE